MRMLWAIGSHSQLNSTMLTKVSASFASQAHIQVSYNRVNTTPATRDSGIYDACILWTFTCFTFLCTWLIRKCAKRALPRLHHLWGLACLTLFGITLIEQCAFATCPSKLGGVSTKVR